MSSTAYGCYIIPVPNSRPSNDLDHITSNATAVCSKNKHVGLRRKTADLGHECPPSIRNGRNVMVADARPNPNASRQIDLSSK